MAKWYTVRRYGKYITDAAFSTGKEALAHYDKACRYELKRDNRDIAMFVYDDRFYKKYGSSEMMIFFNKKPVPKWPFCKYRNVAVECKKTKKRSKKEYGISGELHPFGL